MLVHTTDARLSCQGGGRERWGLWQTEPPAARGVTYSGGPREVGTLPYECSGAAVTTYPNPRGREQYKHIVSSFWRLEVRSQGVGKAVAPLKPVGESFLGSFSFW